MGSDAVDDMAAYAAQRAACRGRGCFEPERQAGLRTTAAALPAELAGRDMLEIACGSGGWTPPAARAVAARLASGPNPETMAVARAKALPGGVRFAAVDACSLDDGSVHAVPKHFPTREQAAAMRGPRAHGLRRVERTHHSGRTAGGRRMRRAEAARPGPAAWTR